MSVIVRGSKSIRRSASPTSPARSSATIHPSSTIISSTTRPPASVARRTAVYLRLGTPLATRCFRHSSGSTFARRLRGGDLECMGSGRRYNASGVKPMPSTTRERRPTWELADVLLPYQGDWTVERYLALDTNRLIEFTDGFLEVLPMPEEIHAF